DDVLEPFIDADDIADIAVAALTDDKHVGQLYEVTGPRLMTFRDLVAEVSKATGREIRYIPISFDEYQAGMLEHGVPEDLAKGLTELFRAILDGRSSYVTDGVQRALGRAPRDFSEFAREMAQAGVWSAPAASAQSHP
ncbi:MAG TPA: hypothetical protein VE621_20865, partial [Bryobacteraceae bacterium]|nr:hypothetical protein [Bryobacteraceae bacterium]